MAITSVGYAGTVDDTEWPLVTRYAGGATYNVAGSGDFAATPGVGDRAVQIAAGTAAGHGVVDVSDGPVTLLLPSVSSGDRWDLIGLERDWASGVSSIVRVAGSASKAIPSRPDDPGVEDVQPLWLVRVRAGQTTVQEFVDLRVWVGDGGAFANDDLVRSYVTRVGTVLTIGSDVWSRVIGSTGAAEWSREPRAVDTGWTTTGLVIASGWDGFSGLGVRRVGVVVEVRFRVDRNGSTISESGGNLTDTLVATLPAGFRPSNSDVRVVVSGSVAAVGRVDSAGNLYLDTGAGPIANNDTVVISGTFLLG